MALADKVQANLETNKPAVLAQVRAAGVDGLAVAQTLASAVVDKAFEQDIPFAPFQKPAVVASVAEHTQEAVAAVGGGEEWFFNLLKKAAAQIAVAIEAELGKVL